MYKREADRLPSFFIVHFKESRQKEVV